MNTEELKAIVAGKPEGATHFNASWHYSGGYAEYEAPTNIRSLSDIEKLIAQADEIAELREMIKSFMATNEDLNEWRFEMESTISELLAKGESNG